MIKDIEKLLQSSKAGVKMNKIFLWDKAEYSDDMEFSKDEINPESYLMLRLGDILYVAYRCIPVILPEEKEIFDREFLDRMRHNDGRAYFKTHVRFSDIAVIYRRIREKLRTCGTCTEIAEMAVEICSAYARTQSIEPFVDGGTAWKASESFKSEAVSYLNAIYSYRASSGSARPLIQVLRSFLADDSVSPKKISSNFSSQLNLRKSNGIDPNIYRVFYPNDQLFRKRGGSEDMDGKSKDESSDDWCTSIYHFIIKSALGTTPAQYNPLIQSSKKLQNNLTMPERIAKFIPHFCLQNLKFFEQTPDFQNIAGYILERITNVNLINSLHRKILNTVNLDFIKFSILAMHPLVRFRRELIEHLDVQKNPAATNLQNLLLEQTMFYFPLLCRIFDLLLEIHKCDTMPSTTGTATGTVLKTSYDHGFEVFKKDVEDIAPIVDFPKSMSGSIGKAYECVAQSVYDIYRLSLDLPDVPYIIYKDRWYSKPEDYLREIYDNTGIARKLGKIIQKQRKSLGKL